jgi:Flp pilus assembly pilin Flp
VGSLGSLRPRTRQDRGAAAVEFALVVPLLVVVAFGIIDFGLFFSNGLSARHGVREATRQGVVGEFGGSSSCGRSWAVEPSDDLKTLACTAIEDTSGVVGDSYVRIELPDGWDKGKQLKVCVAVVTEGITGITPLPYDGVVSGRVAMSIEQPGSGAQSPGWESLPAGLSWAELC